MMPPGLDGSPVPLWAVDGTAPLPANGYRGAEHLPAWAFLVLWFMIAGILFMMMLCAGEQADRKADRRREEMRRMCEKILEEQTELDRELLIDRAGRKPWQ